MPSCRPVAAITPAFASCSPSNATPSTVNPDVAPPAEAVSTVDPVRPHTETCSSCSWLPLVTAPARVNTNANPRHARTTAATVTARHTYGATLRPRWAASIVVGSIAHPPPGSGV